VVVLVRLVQQAQLAMVGLAEVHTIHLLQEQESQVREMMAVLGMAAVVVLVRLALLGVVVAVLHQRMAVMESHHLLQAHLCTGLVAVVAVQSTAAMASVDKVVAVTRTVITAQRTQAAVVVKVEVMAALV